MLAETHQEVSRRFLLHAEEQLALGDSLQASEKGWGAAAHAVKSVAERRGWRHRTHSDLFRVANMIASEPDRREVIELFGLAHSLHQNFYEGWMTDGFISDSLNRMSRLLDILDEVAGETEG